MKIKYKVKYNKPIIYNDWKYFYKLLKEDKLKSFHDNLHKCYSCGKNLKMGHNFYYQIGISYKDIITYNNIYINDLEQYVVFCEDCKDEGYILAKKLCEYLTNYNKGEIN